MKMAVAAEASRLLIFNAYQDETTTCRSIIRDGVGIDRATGAARKSIWCEV